MYVVALVENKEQVLLAHNIIIKHEVPAHSHSFGYDRPYYMATHNDRFEIGLEDVIAMREHSELLTAGMYTGLPELLLHEEKSNYGHIISAGTITSFMHDAFPICEDTFHFSHVKIVCMQLIGCKLSDGSTNLSPQEKEILRNIFIYTKGYNDG